MTDTVSTEELQFLQRALHGAHRQLDEANAAFERATDAIVKCEERVRITEQVFEAAGGTKELLRRSVELEASNAGS